MASLTSQKLPNKREVHWLSVTLNIQGVISSLFGLYFVIYEAKLLTTVFAIILTVFAALGQTAGAHRLWAHKSYNASTSLKLFLMFCQTLAGNCSIYNWVRLHRLRHKYFKTDLDPNPPSKGFLYSHFTSNCLTLSKAQEEALREIDMSDLKQDKIVMFQKNWYWVLYIIFAILLPINAPVEYWGETILNSSFIIGWLRLYASYNLSLLIHSAFNIFDSDNNINESISVFFLNKSQWISYHYLAPWDYQTSEYGKYGTDCTSKFIRVCAALDLASDLKTATTAMVRNALVMSVGTKKPIEQCLSEISSDLPNEHYLTPAKYL